MDTQDYTDYYKSLNIQGRQAWDRQEQFLAAYSELGKLNLAAEASGIPMGTVKSWQLSDTHLFKKRLQEAHAKCVEKWEQLMDERLTNPQGNRGSDVLLMFKLKAMAPEKYREEVKVLNAVAPIQMLERLRELAMKERAAQQALEAPAMEGEFREMAPDGGAEATRVPDTPPLPPRVNSPAPQPPVSAGSEPPEPPKKPGRWRGKQRRQVKRR
jgi:hypothetical protein